jgi:hypothetical protein
MDDSPEGGRLTPKKLQMKLTVDEEFGFLGGA